MMSEKIHVELGCGDNRRDMTGWKNIGVDSVKGNVVDYVTEMGFEKIPLEDSSVDLVGAYDVLEHIPKQVCMLDGDELVKKFPLIFLMNDIYRILKDEGEFHMEIPYSDQGYYRDPTHVTRLSEDWYHYFQNEDNLYYDQRIVTCNFKLKSSSFRRYKWNDKDIMRNELIAVKSVSSSSIETQPKISTEADHKPLI
jgi:predicted SAM-dependent methyltransferase